MGEEQEAAVAVLKAAGWQEVTTLYYTGQGNFWVLGDPEALEDVGPAGWPSKFLRVKEPFYRQKEAIITEYRADPPQADDETTNIYGRDYYSEAGNCVRGIELAGAINNHCVRKRQDQKSKEAQARAWAEE